MAESWSDPPSSALAVGGLLACGGLLKHEGLRCPHLQPSLLDMAGEEAAKPAGEETAVEKEQVVTLNCRHRFHEYCVRGWLIVGAGPRNMDCPPTRWP